MRFEHNFDALIVFLVERFVNIRRILKVDLLRQGFYTQISRAIL